jgi:predicted PurR-regulated permease PerM
MDGSSLARIVARMWLLMIAMVAIAILYLAKVLFLPLAFAILFAFLLAPVVSRLERAHLGRALSSVIAILGLGFVLGVMGWTIFGQLEGVANDLPYYRDNITKKIAAIHPPVDSPFGRAQQEVERLGEELGIANSIAAIPATESDSKPDNTNAKKPLGSTPEHPVQVREVERPTGRLDQLGGVLAPLTTATLTIIFTFFVLLQREDMRNRLIRLTGDRNLTMMTQAMHEASRRITRYFSLQLMVNLAFGCIIFAGLYFIGLPHALLFGALATILRFVPYIGAPIAGAIPTVLSLAVFPEWTRSLLIVGLFFILELITANYAEPRIYGKHTGLSSLAILVAACFWTLIWGPVGLILSVPLTVCLVVIGSHVPALEFLNVMLGDQPAIPPWTCLYQRLLARDEREAGEILETCLKDSALEDVYDAVLIPALILSEEDRVHGDLEEPAIRYIRSAARDLIEEIGFRDTPPPHAQQVSEDRPQPSPDAQPDTTVTHRKAARRACAHCAFVRARARRVG